MIYLIAGIGIAVTLLTAVGLHYTRIEKIKEFDLKGTSKNLYRTNEEFVNYQPNRD